jgi:DNA-binding beta-propeller fold protein YncE
MNAPALGLRAGLEVTVPYRRPREGETMNPLLSAMFRTFRRPELTRTGRRMAQRLRPYLEVLEDRVVPSASISVADTSLNEIGTASAFVSAGSGGLSLAKDVVQGPDGNVYVASAGTNSVLRYNGSTGTFIDSFVAAGSGGLTAPYGVAFGPDGNFYVSSTGTNQAVLRYNGATGAFIDTYVAPASGGLNTPLALAFGSDGNLYVADSLSNAVQRYQGPSGPSPGAPLPSAGQTGAAFVAAGSGGLNSPFDLEFGPDGNLYVNNTTTNLGVLKFDGTTGAFLSTYVAAGSGGLGAPRGMAFDQDGRLYVADFWTNAVHRYDNAGQYLDDPVVASPNSVLAPAGLALDAQGRLLITGRSSNSVARYDRGVTATLSAASATPVSVNYATSAVSATAGADYTEQAGTITFAPGQTSRLILLATHDDVQLESNETFSVQLSNPTGGATIGTGSATATIVDDDSMRQITVSDATATEGDATSKFLDTFAAPGNGNLGALGGFAFGPDGNFYVARSRDVLRYDGTTGALMNTFVAPGTDFVLGSRNGPFELLFTPGGDLLVAYQNSNNVVRYNGTTGADLGVFTSGKTLSFPRAMAYGPDGNLYVNSQTGTYTSEIDRFNGTTGAFMNVFVASGSGGMDDPQGMVFGPDGNLYVGEPSTDSVLRFKGKTGAFMGNFVAPGSGGLATPRKLAFGPDGNLYVADDSLNGVLRFNGTTGAFIDKYVTAVPPDVNAGPYFLTFGPDGNLYVGSQSGHSVLRYGASSQAAFTVTLSTPSSVPLTVDYTTGNGSALSGSDYVAKSGTVTFDPGATSRGILVKSVDDATIELPETFNVMLSNPVGGVIARGQATGTILDNDTKFYVVNDAATDKTYEYAVNGAAGESYNLGSGNTAPRGAAASADGKTVWVVDGNNTVYVYDPTGALLGSWTAGGMTGSPQVEGIATDGTDIWLLDNGKDKVYKYTGAASRRSGSQSAASSFSLASGDSNGKGIVTDGTYLWVVDDGSGSDKVYKYTLSGTSKGSWTIDTSNTSPTGLTLNPTSPSDIWIVDSGTKLVYQYANAAGRTSGSQRAASSFALAAGNSNPQDIADPPVTELPVTPTNVAAAALSAGPSTLMGGSSLAPRDTVFAQLDSHPEGGPSQVTRGTAFALLISLPGSPALNSGPAWTAAGASGAPDTLAPVTSFTPASDSTSESDRGVVVRPERTTAEEDNWAAATDSFFAAWEFDPAGEE